MHPNHRRVEYLEKKNQESRAYWESLGHKVLTMYAPHGGTVELKDEVDVTYVDINQKWVPHDLTDTTHPARAGDMVSVIGTYLQERYGITVAFVSRVRTRKLSKNSNGVRQVELMGLPCKWFSIGNFEEYKNQQIYDHIWGHAFNRDPGPTVMIRDPKTGYYVAGPQIQQPIFPNR